MNMDAKAFTGPVPLVSFSLISVEVIVACTHQIVCLSLLESIETSNIPDSVKSSGPLWDLEGQC